VGCRDLIDHVLLESKENRPGSHGLIFVYGNTGTGKTYTMGLLDLVGPHSRGIVPDSLRYIFALLGTFGLT
jgi:hypothetical protein